MVSASMTLAATGTTTLELVEDRVCTIELDDKGIFQKTLTSIDEEKKEAILTLTIKNIQSAETVERGADIFLVIDDSYSMKTQITTEMTRKDAVITAAKTLANKLLALNEDIQVGVVSFSSSATEGTLQDAKLRTVPTHDSVAVQAAIADIATTPYDGPRTNIDAGLQMANSHFDSQSTNTNRYIIVLTDGVPNNAVGGPTLTYSGEVATKTKATIQTIQNSGVEIYTVMTGLIGESIEPSTQKTYVTLAEEVFGTTTAPIVDKYFYIADSQINETIANTVYQEIFTTIDKPLENIVIKDYFPQEIIDNFDFAYTASPNIGEVSTVIDPETRCITWTIALLNEGEIGTLRYKLTLKENYNKEIVDVILPTNEKVDITYEDNGEDKEETSPDAPTIVVRYEEPVPPVNETPEKPDDTVAPRPIPQTGVTNILFFVTMAGLLVYVGSRVVKIHHTK